MGMRICLCWSTVSCPPSMTYPKRSGYVTGLRGQHTLKLAELTRSSRCLDLSTFENGNTCRIVASIFKRLSTPYDNREGVTITGISNDSTHTKAPLNPLLFFAPPLYPPSTFGTTILVTLLTDLGLQARGTESTHSLRQATRLIKIEDHAPSIEMCLFLPRQRETSS